MAAQETVWRGVHRTLSSLLHNYFENIGIYQRIRYEEDFDINKAFDIFLEETEKQIEVTYWGRLLGIGIEFGNEQRIPFGELALENWDSQSPECVIDPYIVKRIPVKTPGDSGGFWTKTSAYAFIINLYCPKPVFITWNRQSNSLFSSDCNTPYKMHDVRNYGVIWNHEELEALLAGTLGGAGTVSASGEPLLDDPEFVKETGVDSAKMRELNAPVGPELEEMGEERQDLEDKWFDSRKKARKYFVKRGLLGNYIPETDRPNFEQFIDKVYHFIQGESYQGRIRTAAEFFEESYRRIADGEEGSTISDYKSFEKPISIINHIIALESLYLTEVDELKERLSNMVANLMGETELEKGVIRNYILEIYKIRSRYLHGAPIKMDPEFKKVFNIIGDDTSSRKLEIWLRDVVRRSILSFFSLCKYYGTNKKRKELLNILSNPFATGEVEKIQKKASESLSLCPKTEGVVQWLRRDWGKSPGGPIQVL